MIGRGLQQIRFSFRLLVRSPIFALTAILSLAVGIGANTAIFTLANGLLLAPTRGVSEMSRLVDIGRTTRGQGFDTVSYPTYLDLKSTTTVFEGMYAVRMEPRPVSLGGPEGGERIYGEQVSASYFDVLGVTPAVGGFFQDSDERLGVPLRRVVLSHEFWTRRFASNPGIVGQAITLNGDPFVVSAVAPDGFHGATILAPDVWLPMTSYGTAMTTDEVLRSRPSSGFVIGARLKPGVTLAQARQATAAAFAAMAKAYPDVYADLGLAVLPASRVPGMSAQIVPVIGMLVVLVGLVLLVACTNLAGLLLARAAARSREIAVRLALGATRTALVAQLLTEGVLLFVLGGALGLGLARGMVAVLRALLPSAPFPIALDLPVDWRVFAFTAAIAFLAGTLTALVPAWQSVRVDLVTDLKDESRAPRRQRWRQIFIAAQIAFCLVLVVMAGLFLRALRTASEIDPGFEVDGIDVATVDFAVAGYSAERASAVADDIKKSLAQLPHVSMAAIAAVVPLEGMGMGLGELRTPESSANQGHDVDWNVISADYLTALSVPVVRGRNFTADDRAGAPRVAIVNEHLARRLWPDADPVGQILESGDFRPGPNHDVHQLTVVGVTATSKYRWLGESPRDFIYVPLGQQPMQALHFFMRRSPGAKTPATLATSIRSALKAVNPNLPLVSVIPLQAYAGSGLLPQRLAATVAGSLGSVALMLAAIGLYGVTAFAVTQRTREIGIRISLGATPRGVSRFVVRRALRTVVVGAVIGLLLSVGVSQVLSDFLFGIPPVDPFAFGGATAVLTIVAMASAYFPARRASRIDPVAALRQD